MEIDIRQLKQEDLAALNEAIPDRYHQKRFEAQQAGKSNYLIAWQDGVPVGHVDVKWEPESQIVKELVPGCPELNGLSVWPPEKRSQGIGSELIVCAERLVKEKGYLKVGLGVDADNEKAKSLYVRLGYKVWSHGIYHDQWTEEGADGTKKVHDDECLFLVKEL